MTKIAKELDIYKKLSQKRQQIFLGWLDEIIQKENDELVRDFVIRLKDFFEEVNQDEKF